MAKFNFQLCSEIRQLTRALILSSRQLTQRRIQCTKKATKSRKRRGLFFCKASKNNYFLAVLWKNSARVNQNWCVLLQVWFDWPRLPVRPEPLETIFGWWLTWYLRPRSDLESRSFHIPCHDWPAASNWREPKAKSCHVVEKTKVRTKKTFREKKWEKSQKDRAWKIGAQIFLKGLLARHQWFSNGWPWPRPIGRLRR